MNYAQRRNAYKKAVSSLRKQYAAEYESRRATDEAAETKKREMLKRRRLERQRMKNLNSARNAALQEEKRLARAAEFEKELEVAQVNREARRERFQKARQLIVDELEAECHYWMTSTDEVNKVFDADNIDQELWTRPGMYVGAPPSGLNDEDDDFLPDAQFWRYECHTWDMSKTYLTPRQLMLEEIEKSTYFETNVNSEYWNEERTLERLKLEDRAKLRAMVREEGRKVLLKKQRDWMQGRYGSGANVGVNQGRQSMHHHENKGLEELTKPMPAPKLDVLADYDAMEREGVKVLLKDPTKFFVFEDVPNDNIDGEEDDDAVSEEGGRRRTSMGRPVRLKDPLRDNPLHPGTVYPVLIGKEPRPDTRTDREKKRAEREEKMRAAAAGDTSGDPEEMFDEEEMAAGEKLDYDKAVIESDVENKEWEEGLDPISDEMAFSTPRERRLTEDDVDWVIENLEKQAAFIKEQFILEEATAGGDKAKAKEIIEGVVKASLEQSSPTNSLEQRSKKFDIDTFLTENSDSSLSDREALRELGLGDLVDVEALETVLDTLTYEQRKAINGIDSGEKGTTMSREEIAEALNKVPGLSEEQVNSLIELELSMAENKELCDALMKDLKE